MKLFTVLHNNKPTGEYFANKQNAKARRDELLAKSGYPERETEQVEIQKRKDKPKRTFTRKADNGQNLPFTVSYGPDHVLFRHSSGSR